MPKITEKVSFWRLISKLQIHFRKIITFTCIYKLFFKILGPKNGIRTPDPRIDSNSVTGSNNFNRRSPTEPSQTPRKPVMKTITNFFTPIIHPAVKTAEECIQRKVYEANADTAVEVIKNHPEEEIPVNKNDSSPKATEGSGQKDFFVNRNNSLNTVENPSHEDFFVDKEDSTLKPTKSDIQCEIPVNKTDSAVNTTESHIQKEIIVNKKDSPSSVSKLANDKSPSADASSHILMPCNHVNKEINTTHPSSDGTIAGQSTSDDKNSSPECKNNGTVLPSTSTFIQNKENASADVCPKIVLKVNTTDQAKGKLASKQSTPVLKRKRTRSSKFSRGSAKIVSYFTFMFENGLLICFS